MKIKYNIGLIDGILNVKSCIDYTGDYIDNASVGSVDLFRAFDIIN